MTAGVVDQESRRLAEGFQQEPNIQTLLSWRQHNRTQEKTSKITITTLKQIKKKHNSNGCVTSQIRQFSVQFSPPSRHLKWSNIAHLSDILKIGCFDVINFGILLSAHIQADYNCFTAVCLVQNFQTHIVVEVYTRSRTRRHATVITTPSGPCYHICNRVCTSNFGLRSHLQSHRK